MAGSWARPSSAIGCIGLTHTAVKRAQSHSHFPSLRKVNTRGTCYSLLAHAGVISTSNSTPAFLQSRCLGSPKAQPLSPLLPCMSETSEMPKALCREPHTSLGTVPQTSAAGPHALGRLR